MTALIATGCSSVPQKPRGDLDYCRNIPLSTVTWKESQRFTFDNDATLQNARITNGKWAIRDGHLTAIEGEHERSILLTPSTLDPLRIEFDALCVANPDGRVGDISIIVNIAPDTSYWKDGYLFTTASYYNECSTFYREGVRFANTEFSPVVPGQWHKIVLEMAQGQIRYWLDGRVVLEARDSAPLPTGENRWLGLRTYNTVLQIDNWVISSGTIPPTP